MRRVKRQDLYSSREFRSPHGLDATVRIRRLKHPKSKNDDLMVDASNVLRRLHCARIERVKKLIAEGQKVDSQISIEDLATIDEEFSGTHRTAMEDLASPGRRERLSVSLIASWAGEDLDAFPACGQATEEETMAAFFSEPDDDLVPNFVTLDKDGDPTGLVYDDHELFGSSVAIVKAAVAKLQRDVQKASDKLLADTQDDFDATSKAFDKHTAIVEEEAVAEVKDETRAFTAGKEIIARTEKLRAAVAKIGESQDEMIEGLRVKSEKSIDKALAKIKIARHPYGGQTFRQADLNWIEACASRLEDEYKESLGFLVQR